MENGIIIFLLIFTAVFLFVVGIFLLSETYARRWSIRKRLADMETGLEEEPESGGGTTRRENRLFRLVGSMGKFLQPKKEGNVSALQRLFLRAGYRSPRTLPIFFGLKVLLALTGFGLILVGKVFLWQMMDPGSFFYLSILLGILGFYLPNLWIKFRIARRKDKIQRGLPDALDLMVVCVEAGSGMDAAISRTAEEMKKTNSVLAEELSLVNLEIRAGKARQDALKNLALRTELEDLNNLTTLLIQTEKFGTSVAQALRTHSEFMRTKRFQRAEELAQKMPIKLIFPLALFIFPMFLLITLAPAFFIFVKFFR